MSETRDSTIFETSFVDSSVSSIVHLPDKPDTEYNMEVETIEASITILEENAKVEADNRDQDDEGEDEDSKGGGVGAEEDEEDSEYVELNEEVETETGGEEDEDGSDDVLKPEMQLEHVMELLEMCQKQLELLELQKMRVQIDCRRLEVLQAQESAEEGMRDVSNEMKSNLDTISPSDMTFPPAFVRGNGVDGSTATLVNADRDSVTQSAARLNLTECEEPSDVIAIVDRDPVIQSASERRLAIRELQEFNESRLSEIEDFALALENKREELENMREELQEMQESFVRTEDQNARHTDIQEQNVPDDDGKVDGVSKELETGEVKELDGIAEVESDVEYRKQLVVAHKALEDLRGQKEREQLEQEEVLGQLLEQLSALQALRMSLGSATNTDRKDHKDKSQVEEALRRMDSTAQMSKESNDSAGKNAEPQTTTKDKNVNETSCGEADHLLSRLTAVSVKPEPNADAEEDELMEVYAHHDRIQQDLSDRLKKIYDGESAGSRNDAPQRKRVWELETLETARQDDDENLKQVSNGNQGIRARLEGAIQQIFDHISIVKELLDQAQKAASESKGHPGRNTIAMMEVSRLTNLWEKLDMQLGELLEVQANFDYFNGVVDEKQKGANESVAQPLEQTEKSTTCATLRSNKSTNRATFDFDTHASDHHHAARSPRNPSASGLIGNETNGHSNGNSAQCKGVDFGTQTPLEMESMSKPLPPTSSESSVVEKTFDMSGVYAQYRSRIIASANSVMRTHGESDPFFLAQVLRLLGPLGGPWDAAKRQRVLFALQDVIDESMISEHPGVPDLVDPVSRARETFGTSQRKAGEEPSAGAPWRSPAVVAASKAALRADRFGAVSAPVRMHVSPEKDANEDEELEDWLAALRKKGRRNAKSARVPAEREGVSLFDVPSAYGLMHGGESELNANGIGGRDSYEVKFWGQESPHLNRSSVLNDRDRKGGIGDRISSVKSKNRDRDSLICGSMSRADNFTFHERVQSPGIARDEKQWKRVPVPPAAEDSHGYGMMDDSTLQSADDSMFTEETLRGKHYRPLGRMSSTSTFDKIGRDEDTSLLAGIDSEDDADVAFRSMHDRRVGKKIESKVRLDCALEDTRRVPSRRQREVQEMPRSGSSMSTVARYGSDEYPLLKRRITSLPKRDWSNAGKGSAVDVVEGEELDPDEMGKGEWGQRGTESRLQRVDRERSQW